MAILAPSASVVIDSIIETASPMPIIEDTSEYVPLQEGIGLETKQVLVIYEGYHLI